MQATAEEMDEWARQWDFLILTPGEAYQRQLYRAGILFVYKLDDGKWAVVYHSIDGRGNVKVQMKAGTLDEATGDVSGVGPYRAQEKAQDFIKWTSKRK